jgi:hypothetical protein
MKVSVTARRLVWATGMLVTASAAIADPRTGYIYPTTPLTPPSGYGYVAVLLIVTLFVVDVWFLKGIRVDTPRAALWRALGVVCLLGVGIYLYSLPPSLIFTDTHPLLAPGGRPTSGGGMADFLFINGLCAALAAWAAAAAFKEFWHLQPIPKYINGPPFRTLKLTMVSVVVLALGLMTLLIVTVIRPLLVLLLLISALRSVMKQPRVLALMAISCPYHDGSDALMRIEVTTTQLLDLEKPVDYFGPATPSNWPDLP